MVRIISALILAATTACALAQEKLQLVDNPPDRHIVVSGDTLWGISGKFLTQPWRWPEIWQMNKEQIKNPHRIYPGDIVVLDQSGANPRLKIAKPVKLQPQVYSEPLAREISSIPQGAIEPFVSKPLIVETESLNNSPRVIGGHDDKVFIGDGDIGYVTGIDDAEVLDWNIYRPGVPLIDPETKAILGYEAFDLGTARLVKQGNPATIRIVTAREEISRGARLMPKPKAEVISYVPHPPAMEIEGSVVSFYGGLQTSGRLSVIALNRGDRDGVEIGHVVALFRRHTTHDYVDGKRVAVKLPEERYGLAFVFRTFERISYALVLHSDRVVQMGDAIKNP